MASLASSTENSESTTSYAVDSQPCRRRRSLSELTIFESSDHDSIEDAATALQTSNTSPRSNKTVRRSAMLVKTQESSLKAPYGTFRTRRPAVDHDDNKKKVTWTTVDVYCHEPELGDNPAVSSGPPVTISWAAHDHYTLSIDAFEQERSKNRCKQRRLLSSRSQRENKLLNAGYSRRDLEKASLEVAVISHNRAQSSKEGRFRIKMQKWVRRTIETVGLRGK